jgi:hypothetical protein
MTDQAKRAAEKIIVHQYPAGMYGRKKIAEGLYEEHHAGIPVISSEY